jgi:hypothetical protein
MLAGFKSRWTMFLVGGLDAVDQLLEDGKSVAEVERPPGSSPSTYSMTDSSARRCTGGRCCSPLDFLMAFSTK